MLENKIVQSISGFIRLDLISQTLETDFFYLNLDSSD